MQIVRTQAIVGNVQTDHGRQVARSVWEELSATSVIGEQDQEPPPESFDPDYLEWLDQVSGWAEKWDNP